MRPAMHILMIGEGKVLLDGYDDYIAVEIESFLDSQAVLDAVRGNLIERGKVQPSDEWTCYN